MFSSLIKNIIGSRNQRLIKKMQQTVKIINGYEAEYEKLSDQELRAKTTEFQQRVTDGASIDSLLPEAFAVVREASKRTLGLRHFDVQLIGGMALHEGKVAEMRTGEGKTLVATLPSYLNALSGSSVHVVTVNDYLAQRDAQWMGKVHEFLGFTVGVILSNQETEEKREGYACNIVYGTNNEFGFDYLRDNMAFETASKVQGELAYAIVDEVDSILIDEARTPLIISGPANDSSETYKIMNEIAPKLVQQSTPNANKENNFTEDGEGHFYIDEQQKQVHLTERGYEQAEQLLEEAKLMEANGSLYDVQNIGLLHHLYAALRANFLFQANVDYIVKDGQVIIIDEFTGRMMAGRRWSDGLHQAVEAKEKVEIQKENQTLASITFQNYFRIYKKLSGMTGTADTEATELEQIYNLEVLIIPSNKEPAREDFPDQIFRTAEEKYMAIIKTIKSAKETQQPILVGTASIDTSEYLSNILTKEKIKHQVLNAKQHEREANVIAEAGRPGAVTIATNMAGRGTDIVLGGNFELELQDLGDTINESDKEKLKVEWQKRHDLVIESGGLFVIGTERNESRRVDNQLRGRSGRQGDPGTSRFYLSLEDNLMRIFGSERISSIMQRLGMEEGEPIEHGLVSRSIENAQKKVEGRNFDVRKQVLEYDDVANEQRKVVYRERDDLISRDDISEYIDEIRQEAVASFVQRYIPKQSYIEQWNLDGLEGDLRTQFSLSLDMKEWVDGDASIQEEDIHDRVLNAVNEEYQAKVTNYGPAVMRNLEKAIMLQVLDTNWKEHLSNMDYLRKGINLRSYAQKNPKQEYKRESYELFSTMLEQVKLTTIATLSKVQIRQSEPAPEIKPRTIDDSQLQYHGNQEETAAALNSSTSSNMNQRGTNSSEENQDQPFVRDMPKVGRNDACPCGSGKKYKQCCGKLS